MFGEGAQRLIDALPDLEGLDRTQARRLLSGAWLEAVHQRDFAGDTANPEVAGALRRLATALEVRIFVGGALGVEERRACAFVAAEALGVVRELSPSPDQPEAIAFGSMRRLETVEEALLYLSSGFDANAALTAAAISREGDTPSAAVVSEWTLDRLRALLDGSRVVPGAPAPDGPVGLRAAVRHELWRRIGSLVEAHVRWLRMESGVDPAAADGLRRLAALLQPGDLPAAHADLHHLALLIAEACDATAARALRLVPRPPDDDDGRFLAYQRARATRRPLLWPAAETYATRALPGPITHAVVTVPTGAGKSSVAELAAAQALQNGWVLYLAPTNALVAQIRRDLDAIFNKLGVAVVGLTGGAEYSVIDSDTLEIADRQIAVMTPEKCSLALRQSPELFASLRLCVMDEAHLIGEAQGRGVVAELVLAEVLHRAPNVRLLLLSALIDSPHNLASWLTAATGVHAIGIDEPWRPTRTLRALCGVAAETVDDAQRRGVAELAKLPPQRKTVAADVSLRLLGALHGTWTGEDHGDYEIVDTGIAIKTRIKRGGRMERTGHTTPATQALTEHLAAAGHRLLVFLPADRHAPFSHARDLTGPGPGPANPVVQSLLTLADAEIAGPRTGQVSDVHIALAKGIAIHSSAMVAEEQRACEIAFEREAATVMLATGTLAQGLNLPASAVIIGGTHVGDRREADTPAGRARAKSQLLNAVGRAGRAQTAARSLAIVVPANPVRIGLRPDVATARRAAPWLADEDGSAIVTSQLRDLIANTLNGSVDLVHMDVPEQTAFAFLSFTAESGDATNVLARTLAAHNANAADRAPQLTKSLRDLGRQYLDRNQAPAWIATSAHRAGIALPAAVAFERLLRWLLAQPGQPPDSIELWSQTIAWLLVYMPVEERTLLLGDDVLSATQVSGLESTDVATRTNAGRVLTDTLQSWLVGAPLVEVGRVLHDRSEPIAVTRGKGHDLPRTLRFVRDGIEHALTTVAGAILATVITGAEQEPSSVWNLPLGPMTTLTRLPVALRYGASSPAALALMQAGLRPRAAAHLIARLIPPPDDGDEITMALWRSRALRDIEDPDFIAAVSDPGDRETLRAAAHVRREG